MIVNNPTDFPVEANSSDFRSGRLQAIVKSVNVRAEPSIEGDVKYILRAGVPFTFAPVPNNPDWVVINDGEGYVMSKYIQGISGDSS